MPRPPRSLVLEAPTALSLERLHYGEGTDGKPSFRALQELGYDLPQEFALFPPLVLDLSARQAGRISTNCSGVVTISWPTTRSQGSGCCVPLDPSLRGGQTSLQREADTQ